MDVACRYAWPLANKGKGAKKEDLLVWVYCTLKKALTLSIIINDFKTFGMWPLNPNLMEGKMAPSEAYVQFDEKEIGDEEVRVEKFVHANVEEGEPMEIHVITLLKWMMRITIHGSRQLEVSVLGNAMWV